MTAVHHRFATIHGQQLFYREAGPPDAPVVVLLHGFPTSSFMYRNLIPLLADHYRVVAPDYPGFGFSDAPPADEFAYTFDAIADLMAELLKTLDITHYVMYVQDYGAPVGWRLALADPHAISGIITQSGNAYEDGFTQEFWQPIRAYWRARNPQTEAALGAALTVDAIRWQYTHGVPDESLVSPDTWWHDFNQVSRPGNDRIQLALLADYANNLPLYPKLHAYLRDSDVPVLAAWGRNDEIFGPAGALAFAQDSPSAEIHLLEGGHFLLESQLDATADLVSDFLGRHQSRHRDHLVTAGTSSSQAPTNTSPSYLT